ncbi:bifunctional N-acetylglucosamine-1-phosphate uridyltransferase/glucosamine-1-phosphate acetyltransferase [Streptomyces sp. MK37H]|uniref:bifunctional UDP-N-acetylglucosamine diphosphorylase/glucosamine-1-phosphate N-acetyltransferase GlmU n=1 Tax=Streptomyces sp. MK37H TaxID=2699117 RepID=UPI001B35ECCE|nr:NTP transferase domain-containing protein [Streptomyces sp. MK37H]MBP8534890.1 NTP transferase domain-containing protein [Streptomyces sp. MK37H]
MISQKILDSRSGLRSGPGGDPERRAREEHARELAAVVLAAGNGERMGPGPQKVLREVGGRAMLGHVLDAVAELAPRRTVVVTGHQRADVEAYLAAHFADAAPAPETAVQEHQGGYGHALLAAVHRFPDFTGTILVACGDAPLLTGDTLARLVAEHEKAGNAMTLLSGHLPDSVGYSLVLRSEVGEYQALLPPDRGDRREPGESPAGGRLREVGAGVYAFDATALRAAFDDLLASGRTTGEYLATVLDHFTAHDLRVGITVAEDPDDILGANDQVQLARVRAVLRDRINRWWLAAGVDIADPGTTWIDVGARLATGAVVLPNSRVLGASSVASGAVIGPDTEVRDSAVGEGALVERSTVTASDLGAAARVRAYSTVFKSRLGAGAEVTSSVLDQAALGSSAQVGPYAYVRPDTRLDKGAKVGTFVEIKNSTLGAGAKVPHLSYIGDADIGEGSNIGGLSGFANYDGRKKYRCVVGRNVRIGGQNGLIAPVTIGDGVYSGARALIAEDVPPGALVISEGSLKQRNIPGWVQKNRPGSASAIAAAMAQGETGEMETADGARQQVPRTTGALEPTAGYEPSTTDDERSLS